MVYTNDVAEIFTFDMKNKKFFSQVISSRTGVGQKGVIQWLENVTD